MQKIRKASRAVILNKNKIAILEVNSGDYHKIPGGGVEENESLEQTAIREALEESGCSIKILQKIGELSFVDPDNRNLEHHSTCFLTQKIGREIKINLTYEELKNNFKLLWVSFDEAIKLFENVKSKIPFELEMNKRDLEFIKRAKKILNK